MAVLGLAAMVTSTRAPFLSFTSPRSSVNEFSIRRSPCRRAALSTRIYAFSSRLRLRGGIILSTVPGKVVSRRTGMALLSRVRSIVLADLAMRGSAISRLTLARSASPGSLPAFLAFLCIHPSSQLDGSRTAPFRTLIGVSGGFLLIRLNGVSASASGKNRRSTPRS
jgi:hypothetical protein